MTAVLPSTGNESAPADSPVSGCAEESVKLCTGSFSGIPALSPLPPKRMATALMNTTAITAAMAPQERHTFRPERFFRTSSREMGALSALIWAMTRSFSSGGGS